MSNFDFKKVLRHNMSLREQQESAVFGLNSTDNDESLLSMLEKSTLTPEQQTELIGLMMLLSKEHGVVLEQDLTGLRSERDRVIPAKPVLDFLEKINLNNDQKKSVVQILDKWGRFNSVRFDMNMKRAKQAPTTTQSKPEVSADVIDVPAFDMKIMDNILGAPLVKVVVNRFNKLGAALGQEEDQEMVKAFKSAFLPMIANMQKRAHIDIAEGMISEKTKRQLAYMKGQKRKKLGFQAYIKPRKGKESLFVQMLLKDLRKRLIDDVDMQKLKNAFSDAIDTIKDPKVYDQQERGFDANPERRLQIYKENAEEILNQIKKSADAASAKALAVKSPESSTADDSEDSSAMSKGSLKSAIRGAEQPSMKLRRQIARSFRDSGFKFQGVANPNSPIYDKILDTIRKIAQGLQVPGLTESQKKDAYLEAYNRVVEAIIQNENNK